MRKVTLALLTGLILVIAAVSLRAKDGEKTEAIALAQIDKPAPDFTLADVEGKTYKLSDYKGKTVVLEWINFDCPFVKRHYGSGNMPTLQATYTKKDVVWFSICSSAPGKQGNFPTPDLKKRIAQEKAVPTAYLVDAEGTVGKMYGAKTTPHMFVIDPKGTLRYAGAIDDTPSAKQDEIAKSVNYVRGALDAVMAGKDVAVRTSVPYGCAVKYQ